MNFEFAKKIKKKFIYLKSLNYWERRTREFGALAVLNLGHKHNEISFVTRMQVDRIFPFFVKEITNKEVILLDFGCGTGRFMPYFRKIVNGRIIGVDPVKNLLAFAPKLKGVEYLLMPKNTKKIPIESGIIDVIWISLVLGGIDDLNLKMIIDDLIRVSKENTLICLVENTALKPDAVHWKFRGKEYYETIFPGTRLHCVSTYFDIDEEISVFIGRLKR